MRILLADSQPMIMAGMRASLEGQEQFEITGLTTRREQLENQLEQDRPDLLIAELNLADGAPEVWLKSLRRRRPELKIMICTVRHPSPLVARVIRSGVQGYFLKTESTASFTQAVRAIAQGNTWFSQEVLTCLIEARSAGPGPGLTPRETEVLELLKGGLSNRHIADCLSLSEQTVCNHVRRIYNKLHTSNRIEVALWARDHLQIVEPPG